MNQQQSNLFSSNASMRKVYLMRLYLPLLLMILFCGSPLHARHLASSTRPAKHLIYCSWDVPTPHYLRENSDSIRSIPYDGFRIGVDVKDDQGREASFRNVFDPRRRWERSWFTETLEDLHSLDKDRFPASFLGFSTNPGLPDWDDDAGWENIANNLAVLAWLAKEGGLKGLIMDPENYGSQQFHLNDQSDDSFEVQRNKARRRGAQVMTAIAREYPDVTLLGFWLFSLNSKFSAGHDDLLTALLLPPYYPLFPSFLNGFLDALPPEATLVDGDESSYLFNDELPFLQHYHMMKSPSGDALRLVDPENQDKYLRQVQAGFGIYLDAYLTPFGSRWHVQPREHESPLDALERNIATALRVSDQYVWTWAEQGRWFPYTRTTSLTELQARPHGGRGRIWEEIFPGLTARFDRLRQTSGHLATIEREETLAAARERIDEKSLPNLIRNGDFSSGGNQPTTEVPADGVVGSTVPSGYVFWQARGGKGHVAIDPHAGRDGSPAASLARVTEGTLLQLISAEPGQRYYIRVQRRHEGRGRSHVRVRWQERTGNPPQLRWFRDELDVTLAFPNTPDDDGWATAEGIVTVPEGAARLGVLLSVAGQTDDESRCYFDNLYVYRLP